MGGKTNADSAAQQTIMMKEESHEKLEKLCSAEFFIKLDLERQVATSSSHRNLH